MPRLTTSSASSWAVQWVMGRPDFSGGSQATRQDLDDLLRGELAGGAGAGLIA